jgi:hypothetical protein
MIKKNSSEKRANTHLSLAMMFTYIGKLKDASCILRPWFGGLGFAVAFAYETLSKSLLLLSSIFCLVPLALSMTLLPLQSNDCEAVSLHSHLA